MFQIKIDRPGDLLMLSSVLKKGAITLAIMVSLVLCGTTFAQTSDPPPPEAVILTDEQDKYPLGQHLEILEDPSGELTIEDVSSPEIDSRFVPSQIEVPNYGFTDSVYWARFRLDNQTRRTSEWLLEQGFANMHYVDLYVPALEGDEFIVKQTGVLRPVATRDITHPRFVFNLTIPPQSQVTYYMRFQNGASMTLSLILWTNTAFMQNSLAEQTLLGIFFGVLLGLLIYNLFLFFTLRELNYLFFVILLACLIFEEASYVGYLRIYIIPNLDIPLQYIQLVAFPLLICSMVLFAVSFLELKMRLPKLHIIFLGILAVWGALMLLIPFTSYRALGSIIIPWSLISFFVIFLAGFISWKKGYRASRFFLLAWLGLLFSLSWVLIVRLGLASSSLLSENVYRLGYLWMAVCWSLALADRINLLKADTETANRDLQISENRLSQILEGLPLGIVLYGKDYKPKYVNRRTVDILDNPVQNIRVDPSAGRTLADAIQYFSLKMAGKNEEYPLESFPIYRALHGEPASIDDIEVDQGDRRVPLEIWASPILDDSGNVESAVVAFQDITLRKQAEKEKLRSETRFRVIAENNPDGIAFMGRDREVLYASPSYLRMVGKTTDELIGQIGIGLVHPDDRDYTAKKFGEVLQNPNTGILAEYRIPHKDGSYVWVETFAINLLDNPHVQAVVLISKNINDRKQKELELAEYHQHLEKLVKQRTEDLSIVNRQLQLRLDWLSAINLVNQTMAHSTDIQQIYEKTIEILNNLIQTTGSFIAKLEEGKNEFRILVHASQDDSFPNLLGTTIILPEDIFSDSNGDQRKYTIISKDQYSHLSGSIGVQLQEGNFYSLVLVPLVLRERVLGLVGLGFPDEGRDFTSDEAELITIFSNDIAQLIELSLLNERSQELLLVDERNRLARDLHDSVTQTLFTASVLAETTPRIWKNNPEMAHLNMDKLSLLIRGALAEMRSLLLELRSGELQNQKLSNLLTTLVEAGRVRTRANISISLKGDPTLPDEVTLTFYYIAREALNNAINHAKPTSINISLLEEPDTIELHIQDNGRGFNPQNIPEGHLGISIMLERAGQIGADLRIISEPGKGTEVLLNWSDKENLDEYD